MSETDIRQHDIDACAVSLVDSCPQSLALWVSCADQCHGRTRAIYRRCAEITLARLELAQL